MSAKAHFPLTLALKLAPVKHFFRIFFFYSQPSKLCGVRKGIRKIELTVAVPLAQFQRRPKYQSQ
jgi:hypothetical protein